jgi:perosamine synthetase
MSDFHNIIQFIRNLFGKPDGFIHLHAPVFTGNEKKYLEACIDTTFVSSTGQFVNDFEVKIAEYTGAKKAVACVNGTSALHLALTMSGVDRDTEVITQPLTFIATANAISYCGAHPVFLDVDLETMGLSPDALSNWLKAETICEVNSDGTTVTKNKKTGRRISACVPVHTFGHPCRIDEIVKICNDYGIPVIEDAAESMGSFYKNQHTGTFGNIGILSFNGNKIITTGGGGMLLFHDEEQAIRAKHLTTQAKIPHPWEFAHDVSGYNYRMPNVNAALGLAQLEQLEKVVKSKRRIAAAYRDFFQNEHIRYVAEPMNSMSNYWLNCILLNDIEERNRFLEVTNNNSIMTRPAWKLMNELEMFKNCETDELQNAQFISQRLVNIPSSPLV